MKKDEALDTICCRPTRPCKHYTHTPLQFAKATRQSERIIMICAHIEQQISVNPMQIF